ncbi:MAG TPA: hypothetical protein VFL66_03615 [Gaiellaceae bacterium]|nr:hypothetical protein [Gaiellaceae bacterium]
MLWELLFMILILKIPVVYLCAVVWYAVRAEPEAAGGESTASDGPQPSPWRPWQRWRQPAAPRPRRGGPHGAPSRAYARAGRPAGITASSEKRVS